MEVSLPWVPGARCYSACSGVAPLSLVVSVSGKNSPGSEGMQGRRWWWNEWLLLLGMAHVFLLLGNSYGSLYNHHSLLCAVTWLLCCDEMGVVERQGCQYRPGPQWIQVVNCISKSWMSWGGKKPPSALEGLQSPFSSSAIIVKSQISCCF